MYIPLWIIVLGIIVYFIWKKNKKVGGTSSKGSETSSNFVGRHQQLCNVKKFLGEEVPVLELQIATNKDISEREELIKKLEEVEKYISSDMFTNRFDVESVNKDMRELIDDGYKTCVLTNDTALENRCYKIFDDTHKYLENSLKKEDKTKSEEFSHLADQIKSFFALGAIVNLISLGGLLKDSSDEQRAWIIMNSVVYPNGLVETASSILPSEPAEQEAEGLKLLAEKLLKENRINNGDLQKISSEIKNGLVQGKENWKGK
jgi:hypothetical protein